MAGVGSSPLRTSSGSGDGAGTVLVNGLVPEAPGVGDGLPEALADPRSLGGAVSQTAANHYETVATTATAAAP